MPLFEFSEYDGSQQFRPLSADAVFDKISEHLLEYGDYVLRQLENLDDRDAELLKMLIKEGYLEQDKEGKYAIAPKGIKRIETKALEELFTINRKDTLGKHPSDFKGAGQVRHEDSKPYEFGDPVANLNLHETLKNAMARGEQPGPHGPRLAVAEEDFVVYETEFQTSCATVVLLDMSGSMARYGKFYHAKKVALALMGLVRSRYTEDSLKVIGFYTYASPLSERQLLHAAPKPVSIFDSRVFLRVNLDAPPEFVPVHHRRRADRSSGRPRACAALSPQRAHRPGHVARGTGLRRRRHPDEHLRADRGLLLSRPEELHRSNGPHRSRLGDIL
jgi:Ca-activated chloride channel family protein